MFLQFCEHQWPVKQEVFFHG